MKNYKVILLLLFGLFVAQPKVEAFWGADEKVSLFKKVFTPKVLVVSVVAGVGIFLAYKAGKGCYRFGKGCRKAYYGVQLRKARDKSDHVAIEQINAKFSQEDQEDQEDVEWYAKRKTPFVWFLSDLPL